jgi:hypothetical protein
MDLDRLAVEIANAKTGKVTGALALQGTLFGDATGQDVGDRHARVRLAGLAADQGDIAGGIFMPQGLGGPHAGGAGTDKDISHGFFLVSRAWRRPGFNYRRHIAEVEPARQGFAAR